MLKYRFRNYFLVLILYQTLVILFLKGGQRTDGILYTDTNLPLVFFVEVVAYSGQMNGNQHTAYLYGSFDRYFIHVWGGRVRHIFFLVSSNYVLNIIFFRILKVNITVNSFISAVHLFICFSVFSAFHIITGMLVKGSYFRFIISFLFVIDYLLSGADLMLFGRLSLFEPLFHYSRFTSGLLIYGFWICVLFIIWFPVKKKTEL